MDLPAMVIATVAGVILILVSAPFLGSVGGSGGTHYVITWTETEAGTAQGNTGAAGAPTVVRVPVADSIPSNATITVESCNDGATPPLTQPATITWTLFEGDEEKDSGTFTCAGPDEERVRQEAHPDVGSVTASSQSEAEADALSTGDPETVEFRLEFSWSRPASPGGLPLPSPAFSATLSLFVEEWTATANTGDQEVPR